MDQLIKPKLGPFHKVGNHPFKFPKMEDANRIPSGTKVGSTSNVNEDHLPRVSPFGSGDGLPYAPVNWPNAGDCWAWRVGGKFSKDGFFSDRVLIVPKCLQPSYKKERLTLKSKAAVTCYLRSNFPNKDIGEFFASFTWKIPVKLQFRNRVAGNRDHHKLPKLDAKEVGEGMTQKHAAIGKRIRRSGRLLTQLRTKKYKDTIIDVSSDRSDDDTNMIDAFSSTKNQINGHHGSEDFDVYLNSLDEILAQPPHGFASSSAFQLTEDMSQARKRLSEILGMDLHALLSSTDLAVEIVTLSAKLQNDSRLHASERSILELIQEIPGSIKDFKENKKVEADADRFFADMEANIAKATSYKTKYNEARKRAALLQSKINSASLAIEEIDDQISQLQSLKAQKTITIQKTKKEIDEVTATQKMVIKCLPNIVREVQLAQLQRSGWELKKKIAADEEARILAQFSPLKGFSF